MHSRTTTQGNPTYSKMLSPLRPASPLDPNKKAKQSPNDPESLCP